MKYRNTLAVVLFATMVLSGSANASMMSFMDLGYNTKLGHSIELNHYDVDLTVSAWSDNYYDDHNDLLGAADLWAWGSYGLGICNDAENRYGCHNPEHGADNYWETDFFLFQFSEEVSIESLWINQWGGDSDVSYWLGLGSLAAEGLSLSSLGDPDTVYMGNVKDGIGIGIDIGDVTASWLLVGAEYPDYADDDHKDSFKLDGINYSHAKVPEPGVLLLFVTGLLLLTRFKSKQRS